MALLPEKLAGPQEHPGTHFPAHDIGPLVEQQRQVAPALHPAAHRIADDRFGGRSDHQRLGQFGLGVGDEPALVVLDQAVMRDDRHFLGKALDMLGLALEIGDWDKDREIAVLVSGRLDPIVEQALDPLPDAIAPRLDDHAAAHARFLGHVGGGDDLLIPGGEIVLALDGEGMTNGRHGQDRNWQGTKGSRPAIGRVRLVSSGFTR